MIVPFFNVGASECKLDARKVLIDMQEATRRAQFIKLQSADGKNLTVTSKAAKLSATLMLFIEDCKEGSVVKIPHIDGSTLEKALTVLERLSGFGEEILTGLHRKPLSLSEVKKRSALIQALYYLRIPVVVFVKIDKLILPLHLKEAQSIPELMPFIQENDLDKLVESTEIY